MKSRTKKTLQTGAQYIDQMCIDLSESEKALLVFTMNLDQLIIKRASSLPEGRLGRLTDAERVEWEDHIRVLREDFAPGVRNARIRESFESVAELFESIRDRFFLRTDECLLVFPPSHPQTSKISTLELHVVDMHKLHQVANPTE